MRAMMAAAVLLMLSAPLQSAPVAAAETLGEALKSGDLGLELRYRYEFVDEDGFDEDARASTLRTRLNYASGKFRDFAVFLEIDDITPIGAESYNSTVNGRRDRPIVADPEGTEVNQAYLAWLGLPATEVRFGRQRITLDNHRFIGNVVWRQNEQTYDGLTAVNRSLPDTVLSYGYLYNVNRVFGPDDGDQLGDWSLDSHILNLRYGGIAGNTLVGYAYLLDIDDAPGLSNRTFGIRWLGSYPLGGERRLLYTAEFAHQSDYADNPVSYDAEYWLAQAGIAFGGYADLEMQLNYEVLGGGRSPGQRFVTPHATLHPFQGWADRFPIAVDGGIEDLYLSLKAKFTAYDVYVAYHQFQPEAGGGPDYGDELDFFVSRKFGERYEALLKASIYEADGFSTDATKLWLMLSANF